MKLLRPTTAIQTMYLDFLVNVHENWPIHKYKEPIRDEWEYESISNDLLDAAMKCQLLFIKKWEHEEKRRNKNRQRNLRNV